MIYVKQSTAVTLLIGPCLDDTDGKTAETGLTIAQADVRLSKNGGNMAQKGNTTACTHDELGYYTCPLNTTDTGTLGLLKLMVHKTGALPIWLDIMVLTANVYDTMFSTDQLDVNVTNVAGTSQTGNDNGADINAILADTNELQGNQGDWDTATGFSTHSASDIWAVGTRTLSSMGTLIADIWAYATRILTGTVTTDAASRTASKADVSALATTASLDALKGSGFVESTDSNEAIRDRGDLEWLTGSGGSSPTVSEIRIEMDDNSTKLASIVADTNELQTDDIPGRLSTVDTNIAAIPTTMRGTDNAATEAKQDIIDTNVDTILADTNELQGNQGDWATATGFVTTGDLTTSADMADAVREEMDDNSTQLAAIVLDTATNIPALIAALHDFDPASDTVDLNRILGTTLTESSASNVADALSFFFDIATATKTVNDVGVSGSGLSAADVWTYATRILTAAVETDSASRTASKADVSLLATEAKQDIIDTNIDQIEMAVITNAAGTDIAADIIALKSVADGIPTTAMRGTDNAALASVATETRLAELDAANLPTDIAAIPITAMRGTDNAATEAKQDIIDTNVDAVLADTNELQSDDIPGLIAALNDISVADMIAGIADGSYDLQEMMRIIMAAVAGKTTNSGTRFRDTADSKDRIVVVTDANNNRTGITLDGS